MKINIPKIMIGFNLIWLAFGLYFQRVGAVIGSSSFLVWFTILLVIDKNSKKEHP